MNRARPSRLTPSRMARAMASSGTTPRPVSRSGVMLGANTLPGMWLSAQGTSQPAPSRPGSTAQGPADDYQKVLGCPVLFERDRIALRFDDEALEAPGSGHDPQLFRLLESHAERVLAETPATASFRDRVRRAVVQRLREGEPGIGSIAEALATSERSLQRRLQAEGVSFRDVVDEARHKLAVLYLGDDALSMTDVACLLGYSEASAFTRAFKRWTGQAPSQARR
jgi:AraC-like DNA-binding protein